MKKIIYGFLALFTMASVVPAVSMATQTTTPDFTKSSANWDGDAERNAWFNETMASGQFLNGGGRWIGWNTDMQGAKLLDSIKTFINWALGMLATVALVLCLWGGFQMMTAGWDQGKYDGWVAILKKAAIGLVVIGWSWMLVSIVMWLIWKVS